MKILIVGAGIAGLATAAFLQKGKHNITIIEKEKQWENRGYAIAVLNNGFRMIQKLQKENNLLALGHIFNHYRILDKNGTVLKKIDYTKIHSKFGPSLIISRKELHQFFSDITKQYPVKMGMTVTTIIERDDKVEVCFTNNTRDVFDLVIGADGVSSKVRELVFTSRARKFSGLEYWIAFLPLLTSYKINISEAIIHKNKVIILYPYDKAGNVCATFVKETSKKYTEGKTSSIELVRKYFSDMEYIVPDILKQLPKFEDMNHGVLSEVKITKYCRKRIVLVGDAAHAELPTTGMGTTLALEDAYVLADELTKVNNFCVEIALKQYYLRRKNKVTKAQKNAALFGLVYKLGGRNNITNSIRNTILYPINQTVW